MLIDLAFVGLGLVILLLAGDALVKGAVNISLRLGIPAVLVGLTVVAFGTSAPELLVSVQAVLRDAPGLALGNVVGSNIANILLVLGIPALIAAVPVERDESLRGYAIMMWASVLFIGLALLGPFTWWHGVILLAALALMLADTWRRAQNHRAANGNGAFAAVGPEAGPEAEALEGADPHMSWLKVGLYTVLGLIGLPLGADLLVDGAVSIAATLGVSDAIIGLTLVAVGTSLPELATTVMAAIRREAGVAMGNVIGSNIFNLLGIIGVAALVGPLPVPPQMLGFDLWVMLGVSIMLAPFVLRSRSIGSGMGLGFLALYLIYLTALILNAGG
ncbi:calcium/sodium antiporter [Alkalilacustris brevis]|uniref:calcium/sodium antiporter n=1 Tax=Alkalilacustris brevis TaxID=2026338 RepID=UPI000E0D1096|nr:calcium/sodium antiporter [Alkalilacustris brevis]